MGQVMQRWFRTGFEAGTHRVWCHGSRQILSFLGVPGSDKSLGYEHGVGKVSWRAETDPVPARPCAPYLAAKMGEERMVETGLRGIDPKV